ncbi:unnamed protein product, partial [Ectocarpus sp. 8 AP-2014]
VDGDQDALVILIRGVGSHLDVPVRETRLRGMRVGEAVAALGGTELRFDELDGEREEQRREEPRGEGQGETSAGKQERGGYGGLGGGGFGLDDDDDDALEAYDLWDDQDDLAKVAEPVYLDQLIES